MDPISTDRIKDPGLALRRRRRRRALALLWSLTIALLALQGGAAYYSGRLLRRERTLLEQHQGLALAPVAPDAARTPVSADSSPPDSRTAVAAVDAGASPDSARPAPRHRPRHHARRPKARPPREEVSATPVSGDVRVPRAMSGDPAQGEQFFRMGCGLCHGRTAPRIVPGRMSPRQWSGYFASGRHGRHTPLRSNFTREELAHVKAYLMSKGGGG